MAPWNLTEEACYFPLSAKVTDETNEESIFGPVSANGRERGVSVTYLNCRALKVNGRLKANGFTS
jgi:hypothetical protein